MKSWVRTLCRLGDMDGPGSFSRDATCRVSDGLEKGLLKGVDSEAGSPAEA